MKKITLIGAGQIGGTLAHLIALKGLADVVLFDVAAGIAKGKALDIAQSSPVNKFNINLSGTDNYEDTKNSDVIIITAGIPRKPGMTREELIGINANIVKDVSKNILEYTPNPIIVMVSNPMDTMTYLALKSTGLDPKRVIGMGGALDSSRFKTYISLAINKPQKNIDAMVIGGHGDTTMIPLHRFAKHNDNLLTELLNSDEIEKVVKSTMVGGATLTKLLGTSAWYAPGSSIAYLVDSILNDHKNIIPCSVYLDGEYDQSDICIGVPCLIGKNGLEKVIQLDLNDDELTKFNESADAVRSMNSTLVDHT